MDPSQSHLAALIRDRLQTRRLGRALRVYGRLGSTNTAARAWAEDGAPDGALVLARRQTAGRGRHGRSWEAEADQNLTFSLILRPLQTEQEIGLIPLAAGLALADLLSRLDAGLRPRIKWPNDILLGERKVSGILLERIAGAIILGIGLNVNQTHFPGDLGPKATSLACVSGRSFELPVVLAGLLQALEERLAALRDGEAASLRRSYQRRMAYLGDEVELRALTDGRAVRGRITGIDRHGGLRLHTSSGDRTFYAGDVTFSPQP